MWGIPYTKHVTLRFHFSWTIPWRAPPVKITWKHKSRGIEGRHRLHNSHIIWLLCNVLMSKSHKDSFFGQMWMLFACFHFLPLLHKRPAIPHRQGVQLSWSLPAISQFRSRTLLNPNWAGRELFHVFPYCKCELEGQNFPQRSGGRNLDFLSPSVNPLCPASLCELNSCTGLLISQEYGVLKVDYRAFI